jgi:DNA-binding transcriptional LysR family regulator
MTLDHLLVFATIADCGSLSAAARRLGKAQSTISTALANLEVDLGTRLFERDLHHVSLTDEGAVLLGFARAALTAAGNLERKAHSMNAGHGHRLRLGIDQALPLARCHLLCAELERRFPALQLELFRPTSMDATELMRRGLLDIAIAVTVDPMPSDFNATSLGQLQFVPAVAHDHPLARLAIVRNEDLAQHRQLLASHREGAGGSTFGRYSEIMWRIESHELLLDLLRRGFGWAFLPQHLLKDNSHDDLRVLAHEYQEPAFLKSVDLLWSKQGPLSEPASWLSSELAWSRSILPV